MGRSSSAKKVARLAQRGKGKKVRFQGGSVFPIVVVGVVLAGLGLVAYARASVPGLDAVAEADRQANIAYGFYLCDEYVILDDVVDPAVAFEEYGVADLGDGVTLMNSLPADGARGPRLGNFLDAYGVELTDSRLRLPEGAADQVLFEEDNTRCDGRTGVLSVVVWDDMEDQSSDRTSITAFRDVRLPRNGMVVSIAFTQPNAPVPMPPSSEALARVLAGPQAGPTIPEAPADEAPADEAPADEPPADEEPVDGAGGG